MKIQNTFGIEAQCRRYVEYSTTEEACAIANELNKGGEPFLIVGAGSNLLPTADYDGTVIHSTIRGISLLEQPDGNALLRCGSGETWDNVVAWTVERGFADLANLSLIPGEVGASAVQNIGAYGAEACQFINDIRVITIRVFYIGNGPVLVVILLITEDDASSGVGDIAFIHGFEHISGCCDRNRMITTGCRLIHCSD